MDDPNERLAHLASPRGSYPHFRLAGDFIYVAVHQLPRPHMRIEIKAVAYRPPQRAR